jgi:hypothetical protein
MKLMRLNNPTDYVLLESFSPIDKKRLITISSSSSSSMDGWMDGWRSKEEREERERESKLLLRINKNLPAQQL